MEFQKIYLEIIAPIIITFISYWVFMEIRSYAIYHYPVVEQFDRGYLGNLDHSNIMFLADYRPYRGVSER